MRSTSGVLVALMAFVTTALATRFILRWLVRSHVIDEPRHHSSHTIGTPRGGGLGILAGLLVGLAAGGWIDGSVSRLSLLTGMTLVGAMGWLDDLGVRVAVPLRLAVQVVAALIVVGVQGGLETLPFPAPLDVQVSGLRELLSVLWIVAVTNFFNFVDGLDGMAGIQALVSGVFFAALSPAGPFLEPGVALSGACLGFLIYNWHPSRVFMGDVGSQSIGFFIAALPFLAPPRQRGEMIFLLAMSLWLCLADGTFTLAWRIARGERFWEGHRQHLYQRLHRTGLRHNEIALRIGLAGLPASLIAVLGFRMGRPSWEWAALAAGVLTFSTYLAWTLARERAGRRRVAS